MKNASPPAALLAGQSEAERQRTAVWWRTIDAESQAEFLQAFDSRADRTDFYGLVEDGKIRWHELPIELRGALSDDENDVEHRQFKQQLLEYISKHEDVQFFLVDRKLHICRAHPAARAAIQSGVIPAAFVCPLADADCPMRHIIDHCGGRSVRLSPVVLPSRLTHDVRRRLETRRLGHTGV
jgi:hypothetical protein